MLVLAEIGARVGWPEGGGDACVVADPVLGHRFKPNCASRVKSMESPWVDNRYNACGYRTDQSCEPRADGVRRIDLMGSSTAEGYLTPYPSTVGAILAATLGQRCRQDVQVENMAMIGYEGEVILAQLDEAMALKPDVVVFLVTPFDFDPTQLPDAAAAGAPASGAEAAAKPPELLRRVRNFVAASRAVNLAQHFMFADSDRFAALYLNYGDRADFIRPPFTPAWLERLNRLDDMLGRMQAVLAPSGVKLVLAYVPSRVQAIYLAAKSRPPGIDPLAFGRAVGQIAAGHDVGYVDTSEAFARVPDAGGLFYPQDGHLSGLGQPMVGRAIADQVVASAPPFRSCGSLSASNVN